MMGDDSPETSCVTTPERVLLFFVLYRSILCIEGTIGGGGCNRDQQLQTPQIIFLTTRKKRNKMRSPDNLSAIAIAVAVAVAAVAASVLVSAVGVVDAFAGPPSTTTMPTRKSSSSSSSSSSPFSSAADADTTRLGTLTFPKVGCGTIAWSSDKGERKGREGRYRLGRTSFDR